VSVGKGRVPTPSCCLASATPAVSRLAPAPSPPCQARQRQRTLSAALSASSALSAFSALSAALSASSALSAFSALSAALSAFSALSAALSALSALHDGVVTLGQRGQMALDLVIAQPREFERLAPHHARLDVRGLQVGAEDVLHTREGELDGVVVAE